MYRHESAVDVPVWSWARKWIIVFPQRLNNSFEYTLDRKKSIKLELVWLWSSHLHRSALACSAQLNWPVVNHKEWPLCPKRLLPIVHKKHCSRLHSAFLTFCIIVFYLPSFAHQDLVCRCENNPFEDTITSSTVWLGQHVKSFSKSNKESDFIFIAEYNDCSSGKLIVLSDRNHCTRSNSSITGWTIMGKWNLGFELNNVARKCLSAVCLALRTCNM